MRGMGRMIIAGASFVAAMACQNCVHAQANTALEIDNATILAASRSLDDRSQTRVSLVYTGSFRQGETARHFGFQVPRETDLGFGVDADDLLKTRLYSSSILTDVAANRIEASLSPVPREQKRLTAEIALSAPSEQTGFGFDVGIAPRLEITRDGQYASRRFGGEVRIGQNFDKRGESDPESAWYLFAGADGEALVWEPDEAGSVSSGSMALRDKVTVGDIQAGLSIQRGLGQLSFSYIRREVEYRERNLGASENEDFAGVSFTIRR